MRCGRSLLVGLVVGMLAAMMLGSIALDHNPQGEFADPETGALTGNFYILFGLTTLLVGGSVALILFLVGLDRRVD